MNFLKSLGSGFILSIGLSGNHPISNGPRVFTIYSIIRGNTCSSRYSIVNTRSHMGQIIYPFSWMCTAETSENLLYSSISSLCLTIGLRVTTTSICSFNNLLIHKMFPYPTKESSISISNNIIRQPMYTCDILM